MFPTNQIPHCVILGELGVTHVLGPCHGALEHVPHELCSHCLIFKSLRNQVNLVFRSHVTQSMSRSIKDMFPHKSGSHYAILREQIRD